MWDAVCDSVRDWTWVGMVGWVSLVRLRHSSVKLFCFQFENELITKLDQEVEGGRGDEQYKVLLEKLWVFPKQILMLAVVCSRKMELLLPTVSQSSPVPHGRRWVGQLPLCPHGCRWDQRAWHPPQLTSFIWWESDAHVCCSPSQPWRTEQMEERRRCTKQWHFAQGLSVWTSTKVLAPLIMASKQQFKRKAFPSPVYI